MLRKIWYYNLLAVALLFCSNILPAQNVKVVNDLRSRTTVGIEKELFDKMNFYTEFELGYEKNMSILGKYHIESQLEYELLKMLDVSIKYRFTKNRKNYSEEFKFTHSFAAAAQVSQKLDRFKLYYRLQYQNVDDEMNWLGGDEASNIFRNRIKVKYNIKGIKVDPWFSTELYLPVDELGLYASKVKTIIGADIGLDKWGELKPYYRIDKEITKVEPYLYYTLGCTYVFKF